MKDKVEFSHPILDEVADLALPDPESVVVNAGSALVIRGIRQEYATSDIDLSSSLENIQYLQRQLGFRAVSVTVEARVGGEPRTTLAVRDRDDGAHRFDVHRWAFSSARFSRTGQGDIYLAEQIDRSQQDSRTGLWVASPELVRETKQMTGRPKDVQDIALIDRYLRRHQA